MSVTRDSVVEVSSAQEETSITKSAAESYFRHGLFSHLTREQGLFTSAVRAHQANRMKKISSLKRATAGSLGRHMLADLTISPGIKTKVMQHPAPHLYLQQVIHDAATLAGATILKEASFWQEKTGALVAAAVIEESHLSIHFIPSKNYLAIDVFTCGDIKFDLAVEHIATTLHGAIINKTELVRGIFWKDPALELAMSREMGAFIPGVAVASNDELHFLKEDNYTHNNGEMQEFFGQHVIAEFYLCHPGRVNDSHFVASAFSDAIHKAGGSVNMNFVHPFKPQGISDMTIGSDDFYFHLTVHDWPEWGAKEFGAYAAIDLCSFSSQLNVQRVIEHLAAEFQSQRTSQHTVPRGAMPLTLKMEEEYVARCGLRR
jgi:S-adenosylmethionine decarboxylase